MQEAVRRKQYRRLTDAAGSGIRGRRFAVFVAVLSLVVVTIVAVIAGRSAAAAPADAKPAPALVEGATFSSAQLEQLVAPIALYPDAIAVQVLMAGDLPARDRRGRPVAREARELAGRGPRQGAREPRDCDPSIEALTHFPEPLERASGTRSSARRTWTWT